MAEVVTNCGQFLECPVVGVHPIVAPESEVVEVNVWRVDVIFFAYTGSLRQMILALRWWGWCDLLHTNMVVESK